MDYSQKYVFLDEILKIIKFLITSKTRSPLSLSKETTTNTISQNNTNRTQQQASKTSGLGSKIGSSIVNRFHTFKNSIKNIVHSSSTKKDKENNASTNTTRYIGSASNNINSTRQTSTFPSTSSSTSLANTQTKNIISSKALNDLSTLKQGKPMSPQIATLIRRHRESQQVNLIGRSNSINVMGQKSRVLAVANESGGGGCVGKEGNNPIRSELRALKKYDSVNSYLKNQKPQPLTSSTLISAPTASSLTRNSLTSSSRLSLNAKHLGANNKPAFKFSKITYNDRSLYSEVNNKTS